MSFSHDQLRHTTGPVLAKAGGVTMSASSCTGVPTLTDWRIPLSVLDYGTEEADAAQRVIASKWLSMGLEVLAFEREFAAMQSARHAYAVSSATAALHLAMHAIGIGPGDEVIQPAINFVAS